MNSGVYQVDWVACEFSCLFIQPPPTNVFEYDLQLFTLRRLKTPPRQVVNTDTSTSLGINGLRDYNYQLSSSGLTEGASTRLVTGISIVVKYA